MLHNVSRQLHAVLRSIGLANSLLWVSPGTQPSDALSKESYTRTDAPSFNSDVAGASDTNRDLPETQTPDTCGDVGRNTDPQRRLQHHEVAGGEVFRCSGGPSTVKELDETARISDRQTSAKAAEGVSHRSNRKFFDVDQVNTTFWAILWGIQHMGLAS